MSGKDYFCPQCGTDPEGAEAHQKKHHLFDFEKCPKCGVGEAEFGHYCPFDVGMENDLDECETCDCCDACQDECAESV